MPRREQPVGAPLRVLAREPLGVRLEPGERRGCVGCHEMHSTTPVLAPVAGAGFSELGFTTVDQGVAIRTTTGPAAGAALVMTRDGGRTWREVALR